MIKNIVFDLGGVLLDLDFKRSLDAFSSLGYQRFDEMFTQYKADDLFKNLEIGAISADEFYESLSTIAPVPVTNVSLQKAWNDILVGFRKESLVFLKMLQSKYNLYLLSNTNEIHCQYFNQVLIPETGEQALDILFKKIYYSHQIHLRKPGLEIFEFVLNDAGIKAHETLFIDDSPPNLPHAEMVGMKTHLLKPGELIENLDYASY